MRIGILTFHSQLNYGGILQCWALQTAIEKLGYEVVVIDREFEHQIKSIKAIFHGWSIIRWVKYFIKLILKRPDALRIIRYMKTVKFVQKNLHLTSYSFKNWKEAPEDLGVDLIIVGSDQVWNVGWNNLSVYLLEDAPNIDAIGYGVSLGMTELPQKYIDKYINASKRFKAVSVREKEAQHLLSNIGIHAEHVADPTLITDWKEFRISMKDGLICYFIGQELLTNESLQQLKNFSEKYNINVHIFLQNYSNKFPYIKNIIIHYASGPKEFCKFMASAQYILSDSFHALMFSCAFGKNVRIIRPNQSNARIKMFSRIDEFCSEYIIGNCIYNDIQKSLHSLEADNAIVYNKEKLKYFIQQSRDWLNKSICLVKHL